MVLGVFRPEFLQEETLVDQFRATCKEYPRKTALIFGDRSITYSELDRWSDSMAVFLSAQGIGPGDSIGVWWPRSLELHVAILGIIKTGAAYVPLDRDIVSGRVEGILEEVKAKACISQDPLQMKGSIFQVVPQPSATDSIITPKGPAPDHWAYVIYTSGSTGKPKGIPITHRQVCHFVRAEQSVLDIWPQDKVYQGISVSFDMWCEETWISYFVGATLWVADAITSKSIDDLSEVLRQENISVLHTVPSLLAVMDNDVPSLRLVNAGGEACTGQVVARWSIPGRKFYNSYGPTETTVTATLTTLTPQEPITIGKPLPNYNLAVLDEKLNFVPIGERGELVITGPGVCDGYIERPELTREKFVAKPEWLVELPGTRIYKTGDAAIIHADGNIEFQGRLDDQIKLRGYRIELGEIENQLSLISEISAAAVAVRKDAQGHDHLVGYVVCDDPVAMNQENIRADLGKVLPNYMVPSVIVVLPEMPRLTSGKINKKELPIPSSFLEAAAPEKEVPLDPNASVHDRVLHCLKKTFPNQTIKITDDFFSNLGGHSLLAAAFVSRIRQEAKVKNASLRDVYLYRPLEKLIQNWESSVPTQSEEPRQNHFQPIPTYRYLTCWAAQTISLLFFFTLFAVQIFFPYLGYYYVVEETHDMSYAILTALMMFCFTSPFLNALTIILKHLVIGKIKAGDYPLWGTYYFRWWFVKTMQRLLPSQFLSGTPLLPKFLRLFGLKIADDAQLSNIFIGAEDLVTIGKDVSISSQVVLDNAIVEGGLLKLREIHIGDHAYIGSSSIVGGGARIEAWGELQDLSYLQPGKTIKIGEIWAGSPAQFKEKTPPEKYPQPLPVDPLTQKKYSLLFSIALFVFPFVILIPLLPTVYIIHQLDNSTPEYDFSYMIHIPVLAASYILLYIAVIVVFSRYLQKDIRIGRYPIYSMFYLKKWLADQLMSLSLVVIRPLYATVFVPTLFRFLGAKIGKNTEISTASSVTHPLLEIGKESFIADAVTLGEADVRGQELVLGLTTVGNNSFVGNSALIPQGYDLPDRMLIGVLSFPPTLKQIEEEKARDWFGSPPLALPRRQESRTFPSELTLNHSSTLLMGRATIEIIRILLPQTTILICSILFIAYGHDMILDQRWWQIFWEMPFHYLKYMGLPAFLLTVALKWILVGKYHSDQKPMWTARVWISEAVTSTYESLAVPFFLGFLRGTPWLPLMLRLLGVKTGKRVWMNTTDITEYDMVHIGDDVALNDDCGPQTHLFEDRVMKIGPIEIGNRCTIGARTIILYDSVLGDDVHVEPLSLVMKGESLHPHTQWVGSPVKPL